LEQLDFGLLVMQGIKSGYFVVAFAAWSRILRTELHMRDKELRELVDILQDVSDEYASSPEKARQFLEGAGILTNAGELSEPYRS
jgi:hypothetical protein